MDNRSNTLIAMGVLFVIVCLGIAMAWIAVPDKTTVRVAVPAQSGCACAQTPAPVRKYLIFWKEKDGFKASPTLFPTLESASAAIPRDAEEARIVPVRID